MAAKRKPVVAVVEAVASEPLTLEQIVAENGRMQAVVDAAGVGIRLNVVELMSTMNALAALLIEKGLCSPREWQMAQAREAHEVLAAMMQAAEEKRLRESKPQLVTPERPGLQIVRH